MNFNSNIFNIQSIADFEKTALFTFEHQYKNCSIYREFCDSLGRTNPKKISEIPFLPISFYKTHKVSDSSDFDVVFKSSGTGGERSSHFVTDLNIYTQSFVAGFDLFFGDVRQYVILALLPNYLEQGNSSLIYMVKDLVDRTESTLSGFVLGDQFELQKRIDEASISEKKILLFGVSYALLDLDENIVNLENVTIIETGGMKGKRKEISKEEFHQILRSRFNPQSICSEYGMTELLSQAYSIDNLYFKTPSWMQVLIRDTNDPFKYVDDGKTGGINVIDLANFHSCSFIATQDLGKKINQSFEVLGRFDHSDIRGCNLLVE